MRLIIDTDAGIDDAQAIMMALRHPGVTVEAITTVTGNVHVDKVDQNVLTVLEVMGADVPVYHGAETPLITNWAPEIPDVHGSDGLGDWAERPSHRRHIEKEHAVAALIRLANQYPNELTLITLGPLTNIALACKIDPQFPSKIKQWVLMGGTISAMGNTDYVTAEWNIFCDPEAAFVAFSSFPMGTLVSWETTLQHPFSWRLYEELIAGSTPAARFFRGITKSNAEFLKSFRELRGFLLPDPLAMAITLEPSLITESNAYYVTVELQGAYTRAQTVIDYFGRLRRPANVKVVTGIDINGVAQLYRRMLA